MDLSESDLFHSQRTRLIGLAYRLTGSVQEAEDITHEALLRWHTAEQSRIETPQAWLTTVVTRLSLDYLKSARVKRQSYIGLWLPEPLIESDDQPEQRHALDESVSMALLLMLERLSPAERAAYILHDLLHYEFDTIADILQRSPAACRKLASRARNKIPHPTESPPANLDTHKNLVNAFFKAVKQGDLDGLVATLQSEVVLNADGGGKAAAALQPVYGAETVARFLLDKVHPDFSQCPSDALQIEIHWFNGSPGLLVKHRQQAVSAFNFQIYDRQIQAIHVLRNPDKLQGFNSGHPSINAS